MSTSKTIIVKATDYKYPTKREREGVHKFEPPLQNFNFPYVYPLTSLLSGESSMADVHKSSNLYWWDHCLQNRIGSLSHAYMNSLVHFRRGIPDDIALFENEHFVNRMQFDFYAETYYYYYFTVKDNIGQIFNIYYSLGLAEKNIYLNKKLVDHIANKNVSKALESYLDNTVQTTEYRNSFTHRYPITHPDNRPILEIKGGQPTLYSPRGVFIKTSDIADNIVQSLSILSNLLMDLKKELI